MRIFFAFLISFFTTMSFAADVKISQLPLGSGISVGATDSFPYVAAATGVTKRLTIYDLINVPAFTSTFAPIASPTFTGTATFQNIFVGGSVIFDSIAASGTLSIGGSATIGANLAVGGRQTIGSSLAVTGSQTIGANLAVTGSQTIGGDLSVTGSQTVGSNLSVSGSASVGNGLSVTGSAAVSGSLTVGGGATVSGLSTGVVHSSASGVLSSSLVLLTSEVSSTLPVTNGGTGQNAALTLGSVVFAGASGVYTQDNGNFFWDNSNKRLGLSTTSPSTSIGFGGDAGRTIGVERTSSANGATLTINSGGGQSGATDANGGSLVLRSGISTGTGTSNIVFSTYTPATSTSSSDNTASTKMTLTGNGFLGMGTGTPTAVINITGSKAAIAALASAQGSILDVGGLTLTDAISSGTVANLVTSRAAGNMTYSPSSPVTVTKATGLLSLPPRATTNATFTTVIGMEVPVTSTVTGSGVVGTSYGASISALTGATNNYAMMVAGTSGFGNVSDPTANITATGSGVTALSHEAIELRSQRSAIVSGNLIGGVLFRSNDTNLTAPGSAVAAFDAVAEATHTASVLDTGLSFYTTQTLSTTEKMRLTASGNLGLGSTVPNYKVQINNTGGIVTYEQYTNGNTGTTSSDGLLVGIEASGAAAFVQQENLPLSLATNGASRLSILGSGSVGIATVTPTSLLFVDGFSDMIQTTIQGHSTQTSDIFVVEKSDGTDLLEVTNVNGTKIKGTTTNDDACAGCVGEYVEGVVSALTNFPATSTLGDCTSLSLTAGDWDVSFILYGEALSGTTSTRVDGGIGTGSGSSSTGLTNGVTRGETTGPVFNVNGVTVTIPPVRKSISATTTFYGKVLASFTGTTPQYTCKLSARRVR